MWSPVTIGGTLLPPEVSFVDELLFGPHPINEKATNARYGNNFWLLFMLKPPLGND